MTQSQLTEQLRACAFALAELNLFLDTHPTDAAALDKWAEYRQEKERLVGLYESQYGPYVMTVSDTPQGSCWAWVNGPWPWDYQRGD